MANRTIIIGEYESIRRSAIAQEAISPGQLVELRTDGEIQKNTKVGTSGNRFPVMLAVENWDIGDGSDSDYAADDLVNYVVPTPGTEAYVWIEETVASSGLSVGAATGGLVDLVTQSSSVDDTVAIAVTKEAVTYVDTPVRVLVQFI